MELFQPRRLGSLLCWEAAGLSVPASSRPEALSLMGIPPAV